MLITFVLLTLLLNINPTYANLPLTGKLIIIDPGHGGTDPGTSFEYILEKNLNLAISLELEKEIIQLGGTVILTRDGDYDLATPGAYWRKRSDFDNRINLINNSKADIYLSIHINYLNDSSYSGPQIFYDKENESLANNIQENLNKTLNTSREIKKIPSSTYMYEKIEIPGVLIECGFLSNYNERILLQDSTYQKKIANIIATALSTRF